jgi:hypothetical protein
VAAIPASWSFLSRVTCGVSSKPAYPRNMVAAPERCVPPRLIRRRNPSLGAWATSASFPRQHLSRLSGQARGGFRVAAVHRSAPSSQATAGQDAL